MEKPESYEAYIEQRDNSDSSIEHSSSLFNEVERKLNEVRNQIAERSQAIPGKIRAQVERVYDTRLLNLKVHNETTAYDSEVARYTDALSIVRQMIAWKKEANLPQDPELDALEHEYKEACDAYETRSSELKNIIQLNDSTHINTLKDPGVMGHIETDAYKEESERNM